MRTSYDSKVTFWARGTQVWRAGDVEGEMCVADAIDKDWALEIAQILRGDKPPYTDHPEEYE